jgi:hypothetical protein
MKDYRGEDILGPWITEVLEEQERQEHKRALAFVKQKYMSIENEFPRRNRLDKNFPAELAIWNAVQEVEKLEPNRHLTDAVNLLQQAKDKVADYYDAYLSKKV